MRALKLLPIHGRHVRICLVLTGLAKLQPDATITTTTTAPSASSAAVTNCASAVTCGSGIATTISTSLDVSAPSHAAANLGLQVDVSELSPCYFRLGFLDDDKASSLVKNTMAACLDVSIDDSRISDVKLLIEDSLGWPQSWVCTWH
jgi:hypothetical protein